MTFPSHTVGLPGMAEPFPPEIERHDDRRNVSYGIRDREHASELAASIETRKMCDLTGNRGVHEWSVRRRS